MVLVSTATPKTDTLLQLAYRQKAELSDMSHDCRWHVLQELQLLDRLIAKEPFV